MQPRMMSTSSYDMFRKANRLLFEISGNIMSRLLRHQLFPVLLMF